MKVARLLVGRGEYVLDAIEECPQGDINDIRIFLNSFYTGSRFGQYIPAFTAVNPPGRFMHKVSLDVPVKAKNPAFLPQVLKDDFGVKVENAVWKVLNGTDGLEFDAEEVLQRNLLVCGSDKEGLLSSQRFLVQAGVYPRSMEIGNLSVLVGLMDFFMSKPVPVITLELCEDHVFISVFNKKQIEIVRSIPFGIKSILAEIQCELSLKDESSARKLLLSHTFDFTEKGKGFLEKIVRELQASIDYYEVKTGQRVGAFYMHSLPQSMDWVGKTLSDALGLQMQLTDYATWLEGCGVTLGPDVKPSQLDSRVFNILSLVSSYPARLKGGWL